MPATKSKKPAPKRKTAKVSPLKGMTVDAYVANELEGWQADVARQLIAIVSKHAPKATHAVKWGQPVFESNGPFAYIMPAKAHLTFGFWRGAELQDARGILEGGKRMKHVKITGPDGVDAKVLGAFVKQAVELNQKKGNPTLR